MTVSKSEKIVSALIDEAFERTVRESFDIRKLSKSWQNEPDLYLMPPLDGGAELSSKRAFVYYKGAYLGRLELEGEKWTIAYVPGYLRREIGVESFPGVYPSKYDAAKALAQILRVEEK